MKFKKNSSKNYLNYTWNGWYTKMLSYNQNDERDYKRLEQTKSHELRYFV